MKRHKSWLSRKIKEIFTFTCPGVSFQFHWKMMQWHIIKTFILPLDSFIDFSVTRDRPETTAAVLWHSLSIPSHFTFNTRTISCPPRPVIHIRSSVCLPACLNVCPSILAFFLLSVYRFVSPHLISFIWFLLNRFQCERFCVWVVSFCESFQMSPAIVDGKRRITGPTNNGWGKCRTKRTYIYFSNTMQFQLQQGVRNRLCYTRKGYWKLKDIENEHNDDDDAGGVCKTAFQVLDTWKWNEAENDFLLPVSFKSRFLLCSFFECPVYVCQSFQSCYRNDCNQILWEILSKVWMVRTYIFDIK